MCMSSIPLLEGFVEIKVLGVCLRVHHPSLSEVDATDHPNLLIHGNGVPLVVGEFVVRMRLSPQQFLYES
jgi:hypothetical protein